MDLALHRMVVFGAFLASACGGAEANQMGADASVATPGDAGPSRDAVTNPLVAVTIQHASSTEEPKEPYPVGSCELNIFRTHIHAEWEDWNLKPMQVASEGLWTVSFQNVPVGIHRFVIQDPTYCTQHFAGSVESDGVTANGVRMRTVVSTTRGPGFSFRIDADGVVTP